MAVTIKELRTEFTANTKGLVKGVGRGLKAVGRFSKHGIKAVGAFIKKVALIGAVFAAAATAAAYALNRLVSSVTKEGDKIAKTAKRLDMSAEAVSNFGFAAERSGATLQDFIKGVKSLVKNAADAAEGLAEYKDEFDKLGMTVTDSEGRLKSSEVLFMEFAEAIKNCENPSQRMASALNLMGRAGLNMLPMLNEGKQGITETLNDSD